MASKTIFTLLFLLHCISYSAQKDPCDVMVKKPVCDNLELCTIPTTPSTPSTTCKGKRPYCTVIKETFLFKKTLTDTGHSMHYKDTAAEPVLLCRQNDYNETIHKIQTLFELKLGAKCDPSVEKRLLIDDPRYVDSLSARLESLEDIAHKNRKNSKMCQLHKLQYCQPERSNPMGSGTCVCFYGAKQDGDDENCYASFFGICETDIPAHDDATPNLYSFSPFKKNNLHLPSIILARTNKLNCSKLSSDDKKIYDCDPTTKKCVCPIGQSCSGGSPDAILEYVHEEKHRPLGVGDTDTPLYDFKETLASVQAVMTGKFGDTCSATNDLKLKEVDRFLRDFVVNGNKKVEEFTKADADLKVIVDDKTSTTDAKFCELKRNATGSIIRTDGVAERIPCEQHPYFLGSDGNPVFYCVPTNANFKAEDAENILMNISQPQTYGMPCNLTHEETLVRILREVIDIFHNKRDTVDDVKLRFLKFDILELERVNSNQTNLCNNQSPSQGLRCIGGECKCSPNFLWKDDTCWVRIGGTCHECKKRVPFIPCDKTTMNPTGLKCEGASKCLTPYGSDMNSKQCIVEKIDPPLTPKSSASQFFPNSKFIFVLGLELFVF